MIDSRSPARGLTEIAMPSRRALIAGGIWSVPVIMGIQATPAFAASGPADRSLLLADLSSNWLHLFNLATTTRVTLEDPGLTASVTLVVSATRTSSGSPVTVSRTTTIAMTRGSRDVSLSLDVPGGTYTVTVVVTGTLTRYSGGPPDGGEWPLDTVTDIVTGVRVIL